MARRLGDGDEDKAQTLGGDLGLGGDVFTTGARGNLYLGLRPAQRQIGALSRAGLASPGLAPPGETGGGDAGASPGPGPGDGPGDGD